MQRRCLPFAGALAARAVRAGAPAGFDRPRGEAGGGQRARGFQAIAHRPDHAPPCGAVTPGPVNTASSEATQAALVAASTKLASKLFAASR